MPPVESGPARDAPLSPARLAALLSVSTLLVCLLAVHLGSVALAPTRLWSALLGGGDEVARAIVWQVRLPRLAAAFACGALLALSGAMLQVLLRNPLADPYLLGVSSGAAGGALIAMLLGASAWMTDGASLAGAMIAAGTMLLLAWRAGGFDSARVILVGISLTAAFGAVVAMVLAMAPATRLPGMLYWLIGELRQDAPLVPAWIALTGVLAYAIARAEALDLMSLGEIKAASLGVAIVPLQAATLAVAAIAAVAAVSLGGAIGFVGLVSPHLLRLMGVTRQRMLLPGAALLGGVLLTLADTMARTLAAPTELPVGAVMAVFGVPLLLYLLVRQDA